MTKSVTRSVSCASLFEHSRLPNSNMALSPKDDKRELTPLSPVFISLSTLSFLAHATDSRDFMMELDLMISFLIAFDC